MSICVSTATIAVEGVLRLSKTLLKPLTLVVACALIDRDNRVLLSRRPAGKSMAGYWEFPGGKVEVGETPEGALRRELREEIGIETEDSCLAPFCFTSHAYEGFHLLMPLYVCRVWRGAVRGCEGQGLRWVMAVDLENFLTLPADRFLIARLREWL